MNDSPSTQPQPNTFAVMLSHGIEIGRMESLRGHHADSIARLAQLHALHPTVSVTQALAAACAAGASALLFDGALDAAEALCRKSLGLDANTGATVTLTEILNRQAAQYDANGFPCLAALARQDAHSPATASPDDDVERLAHEELCLRAAQAPIQDIAQMRLQQAHIWIADRNEVAKGEAAIRATTALCPAIMSERHDYQMDLTLALYNRAADHFNRYEFAEAEALAWELLTVAPQLQQSQTLLKRCITNRANYTIQRAQKYTTVAHGLKNRLRVRTPRGLNLVRIGNRGDGGYVMVDHGLSNTTAYSLGIGQDVSWDLDMANRGCSIYQFDHTIDALPQHHDGFNWSKIRIGAVPDEDPHIRTLAELVGTNGHGDRNDLILKIDIEGSEWTVITEMSEKTLCKFSQIVGEFHLMTDIVNPRQAEVIFGVLDKILAHFQLVHIHANNYAGVGNIGGVTIHDVLELTFLRRDGHRFEAARGPFPTALDYPCNSLASEYQL